jgi:hypothetical protein
MKVCPNLLLKPFLCVREIANEFKEFPKIARLSKDMVITEKVDGTNAQIIITEEGEFACASRTRLIVPGNDNYGFAAWAYDNKEELMKLGVGRHFGEWWGSGIQRGYGLKNGDKRFSLFNVGVWTFENIPSCCSIVPTLYKGPFDTERIREVMDLLYLHGSVAAPGFIDPEGVVVFHTATGTLFKKTFKNDGGKEISSHLSAGGSL